MTSRGTFKHINIFCHSAQPWPAKIRSTQYSIEIPPLGTSLK